MGHIRPLFLYFYFSTISRKYMLGLKFCLWLDSKCGPLVLEVQHCRLRNDLQGGFFQHYGGEYQQQVHCQFVKKYLLFSCLLQPEYTDLLRKGKYPCTCVWPPVLLVCFVTLKLSSDFFVRLNPNQSNRRSAEQWCFPRLQIKWVCFSIKVNEVNVNCLAKMSRLFTHVRASRTVVLSLVHSKSKVFAYFYGRMHSINLTICCVRHFPKRH